MAKGGWEEKQPHAPWGDQSMDSTPARWPMNVSTGCTVELRRSHNRMAGWASSSVAVMRNMGLPGCQAMSEKRPRFWSRRVHQALLERRSHTAQEDMAHVARM